MLVLLYHRVHPKFGLHPDTFKEQMLFLKKVFRPISLEEMDKGGPLSVLITFDDGFYDNFIYAYPILRELSLKAVIFVSPERLYRSYEVREKPELSNKTTYEAFKNSFLYGDNSPFLSWGELREMGDVFSVQSHGLSHRASIGKGGKPYKGEGDWRIFSLNEEEREKVKVGTPLTSILLTNRGWEELKRSKELIEENLGKKVNSIAFPWGIYNKRLLKLAKEVGYKLCFTTKRGWNYKPRCKVNRLPVGDRKSLRWFKLRSLFYSI